MTSKMVIAVALLAMAGCARNDQLACGPALPPIAALPTPVVATPVLATPAAPPAAAMPMVAAAPVPAPAPTPAELRALNPLENRAAVAGR